MSFMQPEITHNQDWWWVDTVSAGVVYYPADLFSRREIADIWDIDISEVEHHEGYGARMSAPGYLDCTDWAVFETYDEAASYLEEYYGDDV